jgi:hypothetical protein
VTTLFEEIAKLDPSPVYDEVDVQVGTLGAIATQIKGLTAHPPQGVENLLKSVRSLPLPDIALGTQLPDALTSLQAALPSDLGSVTGGLAGGIGTLSTTLTTELVGSVTRGLLPIVELHRLLDIDIDCLTRLPSSAAQASAPQPSAPQPPGGATPPSPVAPAAPPAAARAAAGIDQANMLLAALPSPITIVGLLRVLARAMAISRPRVGRRTIPIFDDFGEGLATLLRWHDAPDEILPSLQSTLTGLAGFVEGSVNAAFGTLADDASAVAAAMTANPLAPVLDGLAARLEALHAAPDDAAATAAATAIAGHMDTLATAVGGTLTSGVLAHLPSLGARLDALPGEIADQVAHVASVLAPPLSLPAGFPGPDPIILVDDEMIETMRGLISPVIGWLQNLAEKLDLSLLAEPITKAAQEASSALDTVDTSIASLTSEVQHLFNELDQVLAKVDTSAITTQFESALDAFRQALSGQLNTLFTPVSDLLTESLLTITAAVHAFDPTKITALQGVIDGLEHALDNPDIAAVRKQIADAFAAAEKGVQALSFAPVADEVIKVIEQITAALKALDPASLSAPLQMALQGAVALLPDSLAPVTEPLLQEMHDAVSLGPAALTEQLRAPLDDLQHAVRQYEPAVLLGGALSAPFDDAVTQLEAFEPSRLLEPLTNELETLKRRLRDELGPKQLLVPLEAPFAELMAAFAALDPHAIVEPLEQAIHSAIDTVLKAVPVEDILAPVGAVLDAVQGVMDVGHSAVALVDTAMGMLDELADGPAEVQAFADGVLANVAGVDAAALNPGMTALKTAVAATTQDALVARAAAALAPLDTVLSALSPKDRLAKVTLAHRAIERDGLSPAVLQALDRADPLKPELAGPYQALIVVQGRVESVADILHHETEGAIRRYHEPGGTLASVAALEPTPAAVAGWVREALQPQVVNPLRALLAPAGPVRAMVGPIVDEIQMLMKLLVLKIDAFGTAAGSAGKVTQTIEALIARLRELDLAVVSRSLGELFEQVRGKLEAIGPGAVAPLLDKAFDEMLAALDVGTLLPAESIAQLDEAVVEIVAALRSRSPQQVVAKFQLAFDKQLLPLVEAFDLGGLLDALLATLDGLDEELAGELDRVDKAYQAMLAAAPAFDPLSVEVDIDVGGLL